MTNMTGMFSDARSLSSIDLSGWDTSSVTNMQTMFQNAISLSSIDLSGWDTSSVTSMSGMFRGVSSLSSIDLSGFDTSRVTNMTGMFQSTSSLSSIDLSGWDTSSVTSMSFVFDGASNLSSIDLSGWDTSSVTSMSGMFQSASSLSSLDLSSFDTSYVMNMSSMFRHARSLSELKLGSDFRVVDGTSADLPAISTASGEYTGRWRSLEDNTIFASSAAFMGEYSGEAGTYVWENLRAIPPVNPSDPLPPIDTEEQNPERGDGLAIRYASGLDFGSFEYSTQTQEVLAQPDRENDGGGTMENMIAIEDTRTIRDGWVLTVAQSDPLMTGAVIQMNPYVDSENVLGVSTPSGMIELNEDGQLFAWSENSAESQSGVISIGYGDVHLVVSGTIALGQYETTLTWNLVNGPQ
ncbi:hypothetical protein A5882_003679 [Enterococcus sp. 4E1_DIV0656]|nr:hypothetical protein A5882_003679 [Enterococcus sp. 4E1_DIV0656]